MSHARMRGRKLTVAYRSVGAESPLDLPEREFELLQPIVDGPEITWKYRSAYVHYFPACPILARSSV
jgi:hypothetical protein